MNKSLHYEPYKVITLIFLIAIGLGSILLYLPITHNAGQTISYIDALFTATSALCVTGLNSIDFATIFNPFGLTVIAILIQLGGLGLICAGMIIAILIGQKIGLKERILLKASLNLSSLKGIVKFTLNVIKITFIIELVGAILLAFNFMKDYSFIKSLGLGIFHSISAFNNAGFDLLAKYNLFGPFAKIITILLIILGGLGYLVIIDILSKKKFEKLTLHSKIVINTSITLLVIGTLLFMITDEISVLDSIFMSTSSRTAGFSVMDLSTISNAGLLVIMILMIIGASPGSTGGGIKTTTFYALFKGTISIYTNRNCESHKRTITRTIINKSFVILFSVLIIIFFNSFLICLFDKNLLLKDILFEVTSAFCTVGFTTGITHKLSVISKIIICITMFIGRVGTLTLLSIWLKEKKDNVKYPDEDIIVG